MILEALGSECSGLRSGPGAIWDPDPIKRGKHGQRGAGLETMHSLALWSSLSHSRGLGVTLWVQCMWPKIKRGASGVHTGAYVSVNTLKGPRKRS